MGNRCDEGFEGISILDNDFVDGGRIQVTSADAGGFCSSGNIGNELDGLNNVCNSLEPLAVDQTAGPSSYGGISWGF